MDLAPLAYLDKLSLSGEMVATIRVPPAQADRVVLEGMDVEHHPGSGLFIATRPNLFVNKGLQIFLDRAFSLSGPPAAVSHIGLSSDNSTYELTDTTFGGTVSIKALAPAATRTNQTVTAGATFTQADVAFAIRKVGLLNTSTDAGTGLIDYIGGSNNETFTIDLTAVTTWSLLMQILVTAGAT